MRELKFRRPFFDDRTGEFLMFMYWGVNIGAASFVSPGDSNYSSPKEDQQFTGLLDKNGKEIYEGDLIINYSRNGKEQHPIKVSEKLGAWIGFYKGLEYLIAQELFEIEIIGNIYETPELI